MAITGDTMTTANLGLKTVFDPLFKKQIYGKSKCLQEIQKRGKTRNLRGRSGQVTWAVDHEHGSGSAAHDAGGDLATPRPDYQKNYVVGGARASFGFEFDGDLAAYSKGDGTYIGDIFKRKMKNTLGNVQHYMRTRAMMAGDGLYAQVSAVSSNVLTLSAPGVRWLRRGQYVGVFDATSSGTDQLTGTAGTRARITSIDRINGTITVGDGTGAAIGDYVFLLDTYDKTEPEGLRNLILGTGTVQGTNRATAGNEHAVPWIKNFGGAALTELAFQEFNDYIADYAPNVDVVGTFWTDTASVRDLFAAIGDRHRYASNTTMASGFKALEILTGQGPRPLMSDPFCYPGDVYGLNLAEAVLFWPIGEEGGTWFDRGGSILHPKTGSAAGGVYAEAWQGWRIIRWNLGFDDFQAQGKLLNFATPA